MNRFRRWDIFCAVVDNYGDIGVCWRLARQLASEHGLSVRLWVDDLRPLARLCPATNPALAQQRVDGVDIHQWSAPFPTAEVADVVIEAFACRLPDRYVDAMAARTPPAAWINLEYLSAEPWIADCHGMASPHPQLPLVKHFFFPGFTPASGGLLREAGYARQRGAFDAEAFRAQLRLPAPHDDELTLSLFAYDNPALPKLLSAWSVDSAAVRCLVADGPHVTALLDFFGVSAWPSGGSMTRGRLTAQRLPFVPQADYDALLWLCDLNFVRGEDSFVRAQWAEKPLVWNIYPQADGAHRVKLDAFLDQHLALLTTDTARAIKKFWQAWNGDGDVATAWPGFRAAMSDIADQPRRWAEKISSGGSLTQRLLEFVVATPSAKKA
jgi:uncharacterized repeat protein (TIGR03837 family)